jgi:Amiloride-sensitive sodium channel
VHKDCTEKVKQKLTSILAECNCLEKCEALSYKIEIYQEPHEFSEVRVNFVSDSFQPFVKMSALTFVDFLSNVGGFMGLLAGISIISIIELFYHVADVKFNKKNLQVHPIANAQENRRVVRANKKHVLFQLIKYSFKFSKISDMHGLRYTQDQNLGRLGRIFWTVVVISSFVLCYFLVNNLYQHAEKSPVVTRIDSQMWTLNDVRKAQRLLVCFII